MKNKPTSIIIISTIALYNGNSAGSSRMSKFADAIAMYGTAYLFSFIPKCKIKPTDIIQVKKNIFVNKCQTKNNIFTKLFYPVYLLDFLISIVKYFDQEKSNYVFYLYPSTKPLLDLFVVIYLIWIKGKTVFYEANEIRRFIPQLQKRVNIIKHPIAYINKYRSLIKYSLSEKLTQYFSGLVCISTNIEEYLKKYNHNTIRIPILTEYHEPKNQLSLNYNINEPFKICFGGMVSVKKENLLLFIDALSRVNSKYPNFQFTLYGQVKNEDHQILLKRAKEHNISEKIVFMNKVSQKDLVNIYREHYLLVLPRGYNLQNHYGFSTKITEYLESGVPCLVTNVSDNGLFIKDHVNGFIVEPDNPDAMAEKIIQIIFSYNEIAGSISNNALDTVRNKLNYRVHAEKLYNFLTEKNVN